MEKPQTTAETENKSAAATPEKFNFKVSYIYYYATSSVIILSIKYNRAFILVGLLDIF
jgi:hypothetical protein